MKALLHRHSRIAGETAWVFAGQGLSALAMLVGLRLITEVVPPAIYGTVVLAVGVVALAHGLAAGPLMQAVLRFYPDEARSGQEHALRRAAFRALRRPAVIALVALAAMGTAWSVLAPGDLPLAALCLALFVIDVARSVEVTFLNAARRQREMALLVTADAWLRPFAVVTLVWIFGVNGATVIAGFVAGSLLALAAFYLLGSRNLPKRCVPEQGGRVDVDDCSRLWRYALPLAPLPLIGWVSGQADRYLIGAFSGIEAAGLYAALYGLASKPFLMISASVELALRQPFYARVSAADYRGAKRALGIWLGGVLAATIVLCPLFVAFHAEIAYVLLAAEYRAHSALMGWIAAGYVLLAAAKVLERVCYAFHDTRGVLGVQAGGAMFSVAIAAPLIWVYGIQGAAWGVPVYFGVQFLLTLARANHMWRRAQRETPALAAATANPIHH